MLIGAERSHVATTIEFPRGKSAAVADAALIVRAVNSHDALLAVAEILADRECEQIGDEEPCVVCMATAALAAAEEEIGA